MNLQEYAANQTERALIDTTTAGALLAAKIDLYKTDVTITPNNVLTDFNAHVADFTGYAQGTITWNTPTIADDGTVEVIGTVPMWAPTDAVHPNMIYGCYITLAVGGALAYAGRFDTAPVPMENA